MLQKASEFVNELHSHKSYPATYVEYSCTHYTASHSHSIQIDLSQTGQFDRNQNSGSTSPILGREMTPRAGHASPRHAPVVPAAPRAVVTGSSVVAPWVATLVRWLATGGLSQIWGLKLAESKSLLVSGDVG